VIPKLERTLVAGAEALEALGSRYALVGGLAVGVWAIPRATRDVDLYAELGPSIRPRLARELGERGFDVPAMDEELERFGVFRSRSRDGVFLDIFDATGPLGEAILARRRQASLAGRAVWVVAPEDLALLKAFSDRPRDFDDLVVLLDRARDLIDMPYVDGWTKRLDESIGGDDVSERVRRARDAGRRVRPAKRRKPPEDR
jgi:predicted nucleotidyltransferase